MPIRICQSNNKKGYKWGSEGKCYTGNNARENARRQGVAITISKNKRENYSGGIKMKRTRPKAHYRVVKTKNGRKRILVNKGVRGRKKSSTFRKPTKVLRSRKRLKPGSKINLLAQRSDPPSNSQSSDPGENLIWDGKEEWEVPPKKSIKRLATVEPYSHKPYLKPVDELSEDEKEHISSVHDFRQRLKDTVHAESFEPTLHHPGDGNIYSFDEPYEPRQIPRSKHRGLKGLKKMFSDKSKKN